MAQPPADPDRSRSDASPPVAPRRSAADTVKQTIGGLSAAAILLLVATPFVLCLALLAAFFLMR